MSDCPVCGHKDGACTGDTRTNERQIITANGVHNVTGLPRVPKQSGRIGVPGYVGRVELYDPKAPNIRFVQPEDDDQEVGGVAGDVSLPVATAAVERTTPAVRSAAVPRRTRKAKDE